MKEKEQKKQFLKWVAKTHGPEFAKEVRERLGDVAQTEEQLWAALDEVRVSTQERIKGPINSSIKRFNSKALL